MDEESSNPVQTEKEASGDEEVCNALHKAIILIFSLGTES